MKCIRQKKSSPDQSDSGFSQNGQRTPQMGRSVHNSKKTQNDRNDVTFTHLSNQNYDYTGAFADGKAENVAETTVKTQKDPFIFQSEGKDSIVIAAGKTSLSDGQNIKTALAQAQNNIGVHTLVSQKFEHSSLSGSNFQNFLFSQDVASITEGNFGIGNRHAGVLAWNVGKSVSPLQKIQNISNCNSRAFNAWLAEPDGLFYDNSIVSNIVHNKNYYSNFSDTVSNSQYEK